MTEVNKCLSKPLYQLILGLCGEVGVLPRVTSKAGVAGGRVSTTPSYSSQRLRWVWGAAEGVPALKTSLGQGHVGALGLYEFGVFGFLKSVCPLAESSKDFLCPGL